MQQLSPTRRLAAAAMMAGLLFAVQVAMAALPNIELVSLLVAAFAVVFGRAALPGIFAFVLLEGVAYGFGSWWFCYLYVWPLLWAAARALRHLSGSALAFSVLLGLFGLMFGALCSLTYLVILGPAGGFAYFLSGIPFDLIHCAGNAAAGLLLWKPVVAGLGKASSLLRR